MLLMPAAVFMNVGFCSDRDYFSCSIMFKRLSGLLHSDRYFRYLNPFSSPHNILYKLRSLAYNESDGS